MEGEPKLEIPRRSPELSIKLGEKTLVATWYTTSVHIYRAPYSHMNHLRHQEPGEARGLIAFNGGNEAPAMALMQRGYPVTYASEPDDWVLARYMEMEERNLESEIVQLQGGEGTA